MSETMQNECVTIGDIPNKNESGLLTDTTEDWKEVRGYEGLYAVSSLGRVKRIVGAAWSRKMKTERLLKNHGNNRNYRTISLYNTEGKKRTWFVHQLVAAAFLGNNIGCPTCGNKFEINHKNGNKTNNQLDNLEYVTHGKNMAHYLNSVKTT
jgi:hypothetical protein